MDKEQEPINWHQSPEELFSSEKKQLGENTEKILGAWRRIGISSEGQAVKEWITQQILKPVGPGSLHTYYCGTQDTFKLILELMKPEK